VNSQSQRAQLIILVSVLLLAPHVVGKPTPPLTKTVSLKSHGGAQMKTPDWKSARADEAVNVLERVGADSRGGFLTLVLAVEQGPTKVDVIDWEVVRENILGAAKGAGSDLTLEPLGDWTGAPSFKGHRFKGTMRRAERDVAVQMVALMASGVMLTITSLGAPADPALGELAQAVAKTATREEPAP
jgi:hypothetical protein